MADDAAPGVPDSTGKYAREAIDFARATSAIPDGVSSYRILLAWGVVVTILLFVSSNVGMLTGLPGWWLVPALMILAVSGWLVVAVGAAFIQRVRELGRKATSVGPGADPQSSTARAEPLSIVVRDEDVPEVGNVHARLRLVGKPADIRRVLQHVRARQHFEPAIVRPGGAACFPKAEQSTDVVSTTKLAMP